MPQSPLLHVASDIGMTLAIQHKMTRETAQIGNQHIIGPLLILLSGIFKKGQRGLSVHFYAQLIDTVFAVRLIIE